VGWMVAEYTSSEEVVAGLEAAAEEKPAGCEPPSMPGPTVHGLPLLLEPAVLLRGTQ